MPSPVRADSHAKPRTALLTWLSIYCVSTPNVSALDNATVRLDLDNELQPDALLRIELGGRSRISEDDYVEGPPELIAEVAASSAAYDLHDKLAAYRRNGVLEYIVWRVYDQALDWFVLADDDYQPLAPDAEGNLRSSTFASLRLAVDALLSGDLAQVLSVLRDGLDSPEHADFVNRLVGNAGT